MGEVAKLRIGKHYEVSPDMTKTQKWLYDILNQKRITQCDLSRKCHMSRQQLNRLLTGENRLTFSKMVTILWACDIKDDPEEVWANLNEQ